jgi:hypothetical protein
MTTDERRTVIAASLLYGHYEKTVDRESAYEKLKQRTGEQRAEEGQAAPSQKKRAAAPRSETAEILGAMAKSAAHAIGSQLGRQIIRGVLGSILGGSTRRR